MIISYICVVGDGNYCDFTLSVLMIQFPFLLLIQVKSRVLDQVYMVMIILHVLVLLHDFELSPTRPTLWYLLHRCLFLLYLPTPYHIRCSWWWLLYYIVSIAIMIHVIRFSSLSFDTISTIMIILYIYVDGDGWWRLLYYIIEYWS